MGLAEQCQRKGTRAEQDPEKQAPPPRGGGLAWGMADGAKGCGFEATAAAASGLRYTAACLAADAAFVEGVKAFIAEWRRRRQASQEGRSCAAGAL